ncbi:MAG: L-tyrosine/L-tryptophan isonitrile synthase family protein [Micromonosporaceae bacterium]
MDQHKVARDILAEFMTYQRRAGDAICATEPELCERCLSVHLARVLEYVALGEQVTFVLPGFPAKSPNPRKVLGNLPDMAERLALRFLSGLCERVQELYQPGARVVLCSDGRIFTHVVPFSDSDVTAYRDGMEQLIATMGPDAPIALFHLDHGSGATDYESLRQQLLDQYADDLEQVKAKVRGDSRARRKWLGLTKFLFEDMRVPGYDGSNRALQQRARRAAYHLLQRSDAWSKLIADRFPKAVRLSIHPQPCASPKLGIHLMDTTNTWLTPWHGAAVEIAGRWSLMHREGAEALGADMVRVDGRPSHYRATAPVAPAPRSGTSSCTAPRQSRSHQHGGASHDNLRAPAR